VKNLCLLVKDGEFWGLDSYDPPVTRDTRVVKSSLAVSAQNNIQIVNQFGAANRDASTLVIISHGLEFDDGSPIGGAFYFGNRTILAASGIAKLRSWRPYFNDLIIVGCAVAATTKPFRLDSGMLSGNGPSFCQTLADQLVVTVHASTKDMRLHAWNTPDTGDDVMEWVSFIKAAGKHVAFSPRY